MRLFHYLEHLFFLDSLYLHPIYTHIPQYPEITGYFFIPSYNTMVLLLTIWKEWSCKNIQHIKTHQAS